MLIVSRIFAHAAWCSVVDFWMSTCVFFVCFERVDGFVEGVCVHSHTLFVLLFQHFQLLVLVLLQLLYLFLIFGDQHVQRVELFEVC